MSINYHAMQSRGYLFEDFEVQCEQWRRIFSGYDPQRIAKILDLKYDEQYLYIFYFQVPYRLRLRDGVLEKCRDGKWGGELYFNETMSIYHLLQYTKDCPGVSGEWIPNDRLDTRTRSGGRADPLLEHFAKEFSGHPERLERACRDMKSVKLDKGDVGFQFWAFEQIPLQMIFWDADEDFPAQTQILVDSRITDFVRAGTTGCIVSDLLEGLEQKNNA